MSSILKIDNLTTLLNNRIILENVSFEIEQGEIFGIIGMSGTGKTTILNNLIGFLEPAEGKVSYLSKENNDYRSVHDNLDEVRKSFGFAPQHPSFYKRLTIEENMYYFGSLYDLDKESIEQNMEYLLKITGLEDHRDRLAENLSGGMKRRLNIICGLIHKPDILLLDEPTVDLDPVFRDQTWKLIKKINDIGTTVVIASHFLNELEGICDSIAFIHSGKMIEYGELTDVKGSLGSEKAQIHIETDKGYFDKISSSLSKNKIVDISTDPDDQEMTISTTDPDQSLRELLDIRDDIEFYSLKIHRPSLKEVFEEAVLNQ